MNNTLKEFNLYLQKIGLLENDEEFHMNLNIDEDNYESQVIKHLTDYITSSLRNMKNPSSVKYSTHKNIFSLDRIYNKFIENDDENIIKLFKRLFCIKGKAMELDEKPKETWGDVGGLDKQVEELIEAIVLPIEQKHLFTTLGIKPPKGVLMYGPPGTGKTLLARACANQTKATFLKLAGSQLVQMYIGDGAKMVRDAFALAKEKAPTIIFIDEIDSIGVKRSGESSGREVQRTMLELLNQLDGFSSNENIKVIAATNRVDVLDPALMRSGRLDRKIEFPHPNEKARANIMEIHSKKMNYDKKYVNFKELARCTEDFNGAMLKAVCVEGGMIALRRGAAEVSHEDFVEGINAVKSKKKAKLYYFS